MNTVNALILFLAAIAGGLAGLLLFSRVKQNLSLLLAFSGAFLLGLTCLHMLPAVFTSDGNFGIWILGGFLLQVLLDYFSKGAEHGHIHHEDIHGQSSIPLGIFISLWLHAFIETMPLGNATHHHHPVGEELLIGLAVHKIPIAMALGILTASTRKASRWLYLVLFAMAAPAGILVGDFLDLWIPPSVNIDGVLLALVSGILLHVATTIIFESSSEHRFSRYKLLAVIIGFSLALFIS